MKRILGTSVLGLVVTAGGYFFLPAAAAQTAAGVPQYEVDPSWPKPLPNNWIHGDAPEVFADAKDHIWLLSRPRTLPEDAIGASTKPPTSVCCVPAPPVIEFDQAGNVVQAWGGPGPGYDWPNSEHGLVVDHKENVWIGGNGPGDGSILKFTRNGKFLLQIGKQDKTAKLIEGRGQPRSAPRSNDLERMNMPAQIRVWEKTNEVFVSDGYGNRRVIVFDADTGQYKRHWGAYGKKPNDEESNERTYQGPGPAQFNTPHGLGISNDGIVYVADRQNNRVQLFTIDGKFIKEAFILRHTINKGTAYNIEFSPDKEQKYLFVTDGGNSKVNILNRQTLEVVGSFGRKGPYPGQWKWVHGLAVDSKGNVFTSESQGNRMQKFVAKPAATTASR